MFDFAGAFGGGGGYDFGSTSSSADGGTQSINYRSQSSNGVSPLLLGALALAATYFITRGK